MKVTRDLICAIQSRAIRQALFSYSTSALIVCVLLSGCLSTPQYLLPGGYSSTYRKALVGESLTPHPSSTATALPSSVDHRQANAKKEKKR